MNYIIVEIQTTGGSSAVLKQVKGNINEAEQAYHTVLAAAAVSSVETHSAAMLNERGQLVKYECFVHAEPEPEPEEQSK